MRLKRVSISLALLAALLFTVQPAFASSLLGGTRIGSSREAGTEALAGTVTTYAAAALDKGWDARFVANSTADVLAVTMNWVAVTAAGTVDIRVETDDGAGKPSGTLYDANAHLDAQVPAAGVKTYTFVTPPATGLTIGTLYHVLLITATAGTTMTMTSHLAPASPTSTPTTVLTTATAVTRNTFTDVGGVTPSLILTRSGPTTESFELLFSPFTGNSDSLIYLTNAAAAKIVTVGTVSVWGYAIDYIGLVGAPAGNLRIRLFDSSDAVVAGSTVTIDKDVVVSTRGMRVPIGTPISVTAGTYRIVLDSAVSADSTHCYFMRSVTAMDAAAIPNATRDTTTDITATPPTWTPTTTSQATLGLLINTITTPAATGGVIGG